MLREKKLVPQFSLRVDRPVVRRGYEKKILRVSISMQIGNYDSIIKRTAKRRDTAAEEASQRKAGAGGALNSKTLGFEQGRVLGPDFFKFPLPQPKGNVNDLTETGSSVLTGTIYRSKRGGPHSFKRSDLWLGHPVSSLRLSLRKVHSFVFTSKKSAAARLRMGTCIPPLKRRAGRDRRRSAKEKSFSSKLVTIFADGVALTHHRTTGTSEKGRMKKRKRNPEGVMRQSTPKAVGANGELYLLSPGGIP